MTCNAPKDQTVLGGERCGKPSVKRTAFGPRCAACAEQIELAAKNENTLLGMMLAELRKNLN